jgi:hypothetical protein
MLFILCAGFGLAAVVCAVQYVLVRRGRFPRNRFLGIATSVTRESNEIWARAHEAAAPWIGRAGVLAALASAIAGAGFLVDGGTANAFIVVSGVVGAGAVLAFKVGAEGAAHRAVGG